jgi:flagellar hook-length control protein FliK
VDVRVSQRAGDVEVTVRTPDTNLAQSLRQHLPELSERLSQSGIHGHVWQPISAQASSGDTNGQSDPGSGGQWQREQPDGQRRQPQQQQPNSEQDQERREPSWLNAFITADKEMR